VKQEDKTTIIRCRNQTFQLSAIAGLLGVLIYALINGDRVNSLRENRAIE